MVADEPGELPTCPRCRITLMWPVHGGWQCDECQYLARADEPLLAEAGRHADRGVESSSGGVHGYP